MDRMLGLVRQCYEPMLITDQQLLDPTKPLQTALKTLLTPLQDPAAHPNPRVSRASTSDPSQQGASTSGSTEPGRSARPLERWPRNTSRSMVRATTSASRAPRYEEERRKTDGCGFRRRCMFLAVVFSR